MLLKSERYLVQDQEIEFDLIRKKSLRRNIHVRFEDNGQMKVTAPMRSSLKSIHLVLSAMHDQIAELRRKTHERNLHVMPICYRQGAGQLYLGRSHVLDIRYNTKAKPKVTLKVDCIEVHLHDTSEDAVRRVLWGWLRQQAQGHFFQRMSHIAAATPWLHEVSFNLRLRKMKRSWGTCSASGQITLNPLLMKAPPEYIDYFGFEHAGHPIVAHAASYICAPPASVTRSPSGPKGASQRTSEGMKKRSAIKAVTSAPLKSSP